MKSARDQILARVAEAVGPEGADTITEARLEKRFLNPPNHLRPQWDDDPIKRFVTKLRAVAGSVNVVNTAADVAKSISDFLQENDLPETIVLAPDDRLSGYPWPDELKISRRNALAEDITTVTAAEAGVIETGSLVLCSSPKCPTGINFLPENHIVILHQKQLVKNLEDGWKRAMESSNVIPRTVNIITGPSKTADIEQTMEYGAHGPRRLHVILLLAT